MELNGKETSRIIPDPSTISEYDDAYGEGFSDGRKSMASSIAGRMLAAHDDLTIADITGLHPSEVAALRNPGGVTSAESEATPEQGREQSPFMLLRENPVPGTMYVEPRFVKLVRTLKGMTQASFARELGVHSDTVSTWETADIPIRMKTTTYEKILEMHQNRR